MNQLRFRSGITQLWRVRVDVDTIIEAGDLVWLDVDDAKPASDFPWIKDLDSTQSRFAAVFLGVAHQSSSRGENSDISVDVSPMSIYEFDVEVGTYEIGSILALAGEADRLSRRRLTHAERYGIARAAEYRAVSTPTLRVSFASAFHPGSANPDAVLIG